MSVSKIEQAKEDVYASLINDNQGIDIYIKALKDAMAEDGQKQAVFDPKRLPIQNRSGRKMMQSYFKKRGVTVVFAGEQA